jgi:hypothetical protein
MEMECFNFPMGRGLKDFGIIIISKVLSKFTITMEIIMKAIFICLKNQEKEHIDGMNNSKKVKFNIKESSKKIILKVLPLLNFAMDKFMRER